MLSLVILLVIFLLPFLSERPGRGRPWRVAITEPEILRDGGLELGRQVLVREAILETAERMLAARSGIIADVTLEHAEQTASSSKAAEPEASRPEKDRAMAGRVHDGGFDEVLSILLECSADRCRTLLRRLRSVDASAEWRRSFSVDPLDLLDVEDELAGELHVAYLKFSRRDGGSRLLADRQTYETFLRTRVDQRRGLIPPGRAISILEELRRGAPRATSLHLFEAEMRRLADEREIAADLLAEAHRIAPGDIRPLLRRVPLLLELRRQDEAREVLAKLEAMSPGEPRLLTWREYIE